VQVRWNARAADQSVSMLFDRSKAFEASEDKKRKNSSVTARRLLLTGIAVMKIL
jgi:hypothetical protein